MPNEIDPNAAPLPGYEKPRTDYNKAREFVDHLTAAVNDPSTREQVKELLGELLGKIQ